MSDSRRGSSGYTARIRDRIYDHVFSNPGAEVGGVLVGRKFDGGSQVITGSIQADMAQGDLTSLTFTHDAWTQIHATIESEHVGHDIVGWYHSHPGHGIFLSNHDAFIHQNFFSDPACLALVIDPLNGEEGMFGWTDGQLECFWHQATSRDPVNDVAPPSLIDGVAEISKVADPSTVEFETEPQYDTANDFHQPAEDFQQSEHIYLEQHQPDHSYSEEHSEDDGDWQYEEQPAAEEQAYAHQRPLPPQMVSRNAGDYSMMAYALPAGGGLLLGALAAMVLGLVF